MKSLLLLIVIVYTASCDKCGGSDYDVSKQICCDGIEVYSLKPGHVCCEDEYVTSDLCNTSHSIATRVMLKCGGRLFNPKYRVCCSGSTHTKRTNYRCCQNRYIPRNSRCIVFRKCGKTSYNPTSHICCNDRLSKKYGGESKCCFNIPYNPRTHDCEISGILSKKTPCKSMSSRYVCCSGKKYRRRTGMVCCLSAYMRPAECTSNMMMCGNRAYNSASKVCCNGALYDLKAGFTCCFNGYVKYNLCSRMVTKCGATPYNPVAKICCKGVLHNRVSVKRCCSNKYFDPLQSNCIGNKIRPKTCNAAQYSNTVCCKGRLYRKQNGMKCCKSSYYNTNSRYCLAGITRPLKWCAARKYNPISYRCCGRTLHRYKKYHVCCGNSFFDSRKKICSSGRVLPK